jgi:hypothetical protein
MAEQLHQITETDWGLHVIMKEGTVIDNNNLDMAMNEITDSCKKLKKKKVLVDASSAIRRTSSIKMLEVAETLPRSGSGFKMAIITPELINDEKSRAMENFTFNRGVSLRYFLDKVSAMEWLLK